MKVIKSAISMLSSEGRITLQVPNRALRLPGQPEAEYEEVPDEWLITLKDGRPAAGKESGFLFLTRKGWDANKVKIKEVFSKAKFQRGTWEEFEAHAEEHFTKVKKRLDKEIKRCEQRLVQLKSLEA